MHHEKREALNTFNTFFLGALRAFVIKYNLYK